MVTLAQYSQEYHGAPLRRFLYDGADHVIRCLDISPILFDRVADRFGQRAHRKRDAPYFVFTAWAWKDDERGRRGWHQRFAAHERLPRSIEIREILRQMFELVMSIREVDLD